MDKKKFLKKIGIAIYRYFVFFIPVAFILTSNMSLFLNLLSRAIGLVFTKENVQIAAIFTFWNALFLALVMAIIDHIRRKISIERPIKRILEATERITQGDFSVRIKPVRIPTSKNDFNPIIHNLNKMAQELSGIETLRTDFISNVSHELKTPLSAIQNYGTLLSNPNIAEEKRIEYSRAIVATTSRLSELITNILKLNKLENQNIYPIKKKICLSEQLCECVLAFETQWETKNLELETDIDSDIFIETDADLLSIVWNNLISNAIKFTNYNGKIYIALKEKNGSVYTEITDSGCGMTAETGKHIFEKFYQGDTSHSTQGNGLGLALVKRVVDILDGEIKVESEINKGTTFIVKFRKESNETH